VRPTDALLSSSGDMGGVMGATLCREKKGESGLTIQSPLWFSPDRSGGVEGSASLDCFSLPGLGGGEDGRVRLVAGQRTMAGTGSILRVKLESLWVVRRSRPVEGLRGRFKHDRRIPFSIRSELACDYIRCTTHPLCSIDERGSAKSTRRVNVDVRRRRGRCH
jgi:hypothetical protein